ncbi:hypothetical protein [Wolbachia endosymbiont of Diaphorina citri]|jgi:hypothetical protein|uniref:hypothetical protein n=1 Tax=Wolbachia endosymbiont of Diaphorina citri TaxID=116598 RepID=UPI0002F7DFA7|nr:hypothetical protein [Wolbachia endosymbiont of Diaphorina citri]
MLQNEVKNKISKSLEDYKQYHENATEAIKKELDIDSKLKAIFKEKQQPKTDKIEHIVTLYEVYMKMETCALN